MGFASSYLFTDELPDGFGIPAARISALTALSGIPWIMKPVYGFLSDAMPICGRHRSPYIVIAGVAGTSGFLMLAVLEPGMRLSPLGAAGLLALGSLSIALPDVMIDASVAEQSQLHPTLATDVTSLLWASYGSFEILTSLAKGPILVTVGARRLLALLSLATIATSVPAALGWLGERPSGGGDGGGGSGGGGTPVVKAAKCCDIGRVWKSLLSPSSPSHHYRLALVVVGGAFALVVVGIAFPSFAAPGAAAVMIFVCVAVWHYERKPSPAFARVVMFMFLDGALSPSTGTVMFLWMKATSDNCARGRPCFDPPLIGWLDLATQCSYLLGMVAGR